MRRKITFSVLVFAFSTSSIVVFAVPQSRLKTQVAIPPNEIIVKFKKSTAITLEEKAPAAFVAPQLGLSDSLDKLNIKFRLSNIKPLFKNFKAHRKRLQAVQEKDKALLTRREKHVLQRLGRAPERVTVPALDRIYILQFFLARDESIEEVLAAYKNDPAVEYAELNYIVSLDLVPNDPLYAGQWALSKISAPEAWDIYTGSSQIVVAVADTGVDYNHRDLRDNMWVNEAELNGAAGVDDDENGYVKQHVD